MINIRNLVLVIYILGVFLTFGWVVNNHKPIGHKAQDVERFLVGGIAALTWPVYWSAKGSVEMFRKPSP